MKTTEDLRETCLWGRSGRWEMYLKELDRGNGNLRVTFRSGRRTVDAIVDLDAGRFVTPFRGQPTGTDLEGALTILRLLFIRAVIAKETDADPLDLGPEVGLGETGLS